MVEAVCLGGGVTCLHYDLIWVGGRGVKVPLLLRRELDRGVRRKEKGRD